MKFLINKYSIKIDEVVIEYLLNDYKFIIICSVGWYETLKILDIITDTTFHLMR